MWCDCLIDCGSVFPLRLSLLVVSSLSSCYQLDSQAAPFQSSPICSFVSASSSLSRPSSANSCVMPGRLWHQSSSAMDGSRVRVTGHTLSTRVHVAYVPTAQYPWYFVY
ncbi:hypothetical protein SCLCIDRAFT_437528 [Scleroderma citrinum Foug A]|uniref:Secreted protein n=1 Tax=Scleroderma citrinum Foug A TaxID=1036808 RepID=A0A0C3DBB6_9AGAM|nr:hypothetical protein SCLCIDRAFT_437528 [Scleroderma citrinum Foug A]